MTWSVYVCRADGAVVALDPNNGHNAWKKLEKPDIASKVLAAKGCVLVPGTDDVLRAYAAGDGRKLWEANVPGGCSHLTTTDDLAVFQVGGNVRAIRLADGQDKWTKALPAEQHNPALVQMKIMVNNRPLRLGDDPLNFVSLDDPGNYVVVLFDDEDGNVKAISFYDPRFVIAG